MLATIFFGDESNAASLVAISRISINPQTFNDDVLRIIGRQHSAKETIKAFNLASVHIIRMIPVLS